MAENSALAEFKLGIKLLRDGHSADAVEYLRHAAELEQQNPYYLSFLGVSVARAQRKWAPAAKYCETALGLKRTEAQLYLNLAEVYQQSGRKQDAISTLERGLISAGRDFRIRRALERIGVRRPPVFNFLDRMHPLNIAMGRLRHRLFGPPHAA